MYVKYIDTQNVRNSKTMASTEHKSGELSYEKLKELDALFDKQLKKIPETESKTAQAKPVSSASKGLSVSKITGTAFGLLLLSLLPFLVLIRTSLYVYLQYGFNGWLALGTGVAMTILLLLLYAVFIMYKMQKRPQVHKYIRRGIVFLVVAYCSYGLLYFSGVNAKNAEIESYYRSLHPILRVSLATTLLVDDDLMVTDMQREPGDYEAMGLPVRQNSMHYIQDTGYVHAVDLRTRNRPEWKNRLTQGAFYVLGMNTLRHVGTADHLHISLPVNQ